MIESLRQNESPAMPSGTVTFLFTDIEGSTILLRRFADRYPRILEEHHTIIRHAIAASGGIEVDTAGDGFFVVFSSAVGAMTAAIEAQRDIMQHEWPKDGAVKVRMGLHTGEGTPSGRRYVGIDVHRAARIAAAGHGGQILVSSTTASLIKEIGNLSVVDLGRHRLKDLPADEHLYQVSAPGLATNFPALRAIDVALTNLLDKASSFVGRELEIDQVCHLLHESRLVTLTGPGGTGKTRLAIQIGRQLSKQVAKQMPNQMNWEFSGGVWMVPLAPLRSEEAVMLACLDAFGLHEQPGRDLEETLIDFLQTGKRLIILDNCEHLIEAIGTLVARVMERCPTVTVMATSREPLRVAGETLFPVPPLSLPSADVTSVAHLATFDSVRLFVERAKSVRGRFSLDAQTAADLSRLVRRLDGVPLALELAAARIGSLSAKQIADRLEKSFDLLRDRGTTSEERHRTTSAAVDWSHSLLSKEEKVVFRRLSVFHGNFDLEAAEDIASGGEVERSDVADVISQLVDRSLVVAEGGTGGYRYRMLEIIRQYAAGHLSPANEENVTRDRHAKWYAQQVGPALWPLNPRPSWYSARISDYHNIEAAHARLVFNRDASAAIEMAVALAWFWYNEGYWTEGRERVAAALALPDGDTPLESLRSQANVVAALLAFRQGDYPHALDLANESERLAGDAYPNIRATARTTKALALVCYDQIEAATELIDSVLAYTRSAENNWLVAAVLIGVGRVALSRGDFPTAAAMHAEAIGLFEINDDPWGLATAWEGVGVARLYQRETKEAGQAFEKSLDANPNADDKASLATALLGACRLGRDDEAALRLIEEGAATIFRRRDWVGRSILIAGAVPSLVKHGHFAEARTLIDNDLAIARSTEDLRGRCRSLGAAARFYARTGEAARAAALAQELLQIRLKLDEERQYAGALWVAAEVLLHQGTLSVAARLWGAAFQVLANATPNPLPIEQLQSRDLSERLAPLVGPAAWEREVQFGKELKGAEACRLAEDSLNAVLTTA